MKDVYEKVLEIIKNNFANGIRDDFIDANKVRRIYSTNQIDNDISFEVVVKIIRANGIEYDGRFYFIPDEEIKNLRNFFSKILKEHNIAYYDVVYQKHSDFFTSSHIFSLDVLKKILWKIADENFYFEEFCSAEIMTRLDYEVAKIFSANDNPLSLSELQEKFPYVPAEKILSVVSNTKKYLPTVEGKYIPVSRIQIDAEEIFTAKQQIDSQIVKKGYAAPEDFDLSSNFALNPELAQKDLLNAIHEKFFTDCFAKRGKNFYRKGDSRRREKSAVNRLREFLSEQDELTAKEIFDTAQKFGVAQHVALHVAHETMIRAEKNLFVKDLLVRFDVAAIDDALAPFVRGKIISLRGVTSFTGFPSVAGYSWNLFMLESFLRKYSEKYSFAAPAFNSMNIGAIYPKTIKFEDYLDVQAAVVAQENLPLEKFVVENFLIERGYRAKRIDKVTERIISRTQDFLAR